jgi:hypothetical protein
MRTIDIIQKEFSEKVFTIATALKEVQDRICDRFPDGTLGEWPEYSPEREAWAELSTQYVGALNLLYDYIDAGRKCMYAYEEGEHRVSTAVNRSGVRL